MPEPYWILQKNLTNAKVLETMKDSLEIMHIGFEEVVMIPFSSKLPKFRHVVEGSIFYGSTSLILAAYADIRYQKGIFFDPEKFCVKNYVKQWKGLMLNHDSQITTFSAFAAHSYSDLEEFFVRPDADSKAFSGQVMQFTEVRKFALMLEDSRNPSLGKEMEIAVSRPKTIEKEWRSFVVNGNIVSTTRYVLFGELDIAPDDVSIELLGFIEKVIAIYQPHPVFVLDIAFSNGEFAILECNCFNGTGFYGHDIFKILAAVNAWVRNQ